MSDLISNFEKQLVQDLPENFWDIEKAANQELSIGNKLLKFGLIIGAIFQVICLLALVILPAHSEEKYFSPDNCSVNQQNIISKIISKLTNQKCEQSPTQQQTPHQAKDQFKGNKRKLRKRM